MALSQVSSLTALFVLTLIQWALKNRRPSGRKPLLGLASDNGSHDKTNGKANGILKVAGHNMQRKAALVQGGPTDHVGSVMVVPNDAFDINKTIFKSVRGAHMRYLAKAKVANNIFWADSAVEVIQAAYEKIPAMPSVKKAITEFMMEECDFSMEHADGSFMDHLNFCHDYSALHYQKYSPMVLFLHSIMGVGTNEFPMPKERIPQLKSLLSDFEFKHVEAFPSILRLLNSWDFTEELKANRGRLDKLERIDFFRVIDNAPMTLSAEDLWINLNYQVMHYLDFLPASSWSTAMSDPLFQAFVNLFTFLYESGKLEAKVDFQHPSGEVDLQGQPLTLASCIFRFLPNAMARKQFIKSVKGYSGLIGHSLEYKLHWSN